MGLNKTQRAALVTKATDKRRTQNANSDAMLQELAAAIKGTGIRGPKGEKGEKGEQGNPGVNGVKGDPGPAGKDGRNGKDGVNGKDGKDGRNGIDGVNGAPGADGKDGRDGKDGQDGAKGDTPAHEVKGQRIRFENPDGSWGRWALLGSRSITSVGGGGSPLSVSQSDRLVILVADASDSTMTYTGELLTGVTFVDTPEITNNSKTLVYNVSDQLETITHTFDYLGQTWTVTTSLSYTAGKLTGKSTTIGKV